MLINIGLHIPDTVNTVQNSPYSVGCAGSGAAGNRQLYDSLCGQGGLVRKKNE